MRFFGADGGALADHVADAAIHSSGRELGYVERTTNNTTTSTSATDLGLELTVEVGVRPIKVIFDARALRNANANGGVVISITSGANVQFASWDLLSAPAGLRVGAHRERRLSPPPGPQTFKVRWLVAAGTATLEADPTSPAFLQVVEI